MKKLIITALSLMLIITAFTGCVENGTGTESSSTTAEISSSDIVSSEVSSEEVSVPEEEKIDFTNMPEIKIDDLSEYILTDIEFKIQQTYQSHTGYTQRHILKTNIENKAQFKKVLTMVEDLEGLFGIRASSTKPSDKIDMGENIFHRAIKNNQDKVIIDAKKHEEWSKKYPKTDSFVGVQSGFIEKKCVDETIDKYFCKDSKNIVFDSLNYNYIKQEEVYAIEGIGDESPDVYVFLSFKETDKTIESTIAFAGGDPSCSQITPRGTGEIVIGKYEYKKGITKDGEALVALPTISDENIAKLDKFKFVFNKQPDGSLKVYSIEYL